jgi:hypothetical protein
MTVSLFWSREGPHLCEQLQGFWMQPERRAGDHVGGLVWRAAQDRRTGGCLTAPVCIYACVNVSLVLSLLALYVASMCVCISLEFHSFWPLYNTTAHCFESTGAGFRDASILMGCFFEAQCVTGLTCYEVTDGA